MVSKHVDGEPSPERYRIRGAEYDIELDHLAWEWAGWWEELALAGVLLDFEDGDEDYRPRTPSSDLRVESHYVRGVDGGRAVEGTVRNASSRTLAYPGGRDRAAGRGRPGDPSQRRARDLDPPGAGQARELRRAAARGRRLRLGCG